MNFTRDYFVHTTDFTREAGHELQRSVSINVDVQTGRVPFASYAPPFLTTDFAGHSAQVASLPKGVSPSDPGLSAYTPIPGEEIAIQLGSKTYVVTLTVDADEFRIKSPVDGSFIKVAKDTAAQLFGAERAWLLLQKLYDVHHVENSSAQWAQIDQYLHDIINLEELSTILAHSAGLVIGAKFTKGLVPSALVDTFLEEVAAFTIDQAKLIFADLAVRDASDALADAHGNYLDLSDINSIGGAMSYNDIRLAADLTLSSLRTGSSVASHISSLSEFQSTIWDDLRDYAATVVSDVLGGLVDIFTDLQEVFFEVADTTESIGGVLNGVTDAVELVNFISAVSRSELVRFEPLTAAGLTNLMNQLEDSRAVNPNKPFDNVTTPATGDAGAVFTPVVEGTQSYDGAGVTDFGTINFSFFSTPVSAFFQNPTFYRAQTQGTHLVQLFNITNVIVLGGSANDSLAGGSGNDILLGNGGNDQLLGSFDGSFGTGGVDVMLGGEGNDFIRDNGIGSAIDGGTGSDRLELNKSGLPEPFVLNMVQSAQGITQTLVDGTTIKNVEQLSLTTGSGDDDVTFYVGETGTQSWNGSDGTDTATIDLSSVPLDTYWITSFFNFGTYRIRYETATGDSGDFANFSNIENFVITGTDLGDSLTGLNGDDSLFGGDGNDFLTGQQGTNTLNGGAGRDQISDEGGNASTIDGALGIDYLSLGRSVVSTSLILNMVESAQGVTQTLSDGTTIVNIERIDLSTGFGNDAVTFNIIDLNSQHWSANDGNDTGIVDLSNVPVDTYSINTFWDGFNFRIQCRIGATSSTDILFMSGVENFQIAGGSLADSLTGRDGNDVLSGNGGNDILTGQHGTNALYGGFGNDELSDDNGSASTLDGGAGTDFLHLVRSGAPSAIALNMVQAAQGVGQMLADGTMVVNIEKIDLATGFGDDSVTFNIVDASLQNWNGGGGSDTATIDLSSAPLDPFWVVASASGSQCTVRYQTGSSGGNDLVTLSNVENLIITGANLGDRLFGAGGNDTFTGNGGFDILTGEAGADGLFGGDGNDNLAGGNGNDSLDGGIGIDRLMGNNGGDVLAGGSGADVFGYDSAADSTPTSHDHIVDFDALTDKFDLNFTVTGIDASRTATTMNNIGQVLRASHLDIHHAALVTVTNIGSLFLVIDTNGSKGYQPFQDLIIKLDGATNLSGLGVDDFI
jgi:Ca2+-binding RTX toxin-like protein